MKYFFCLIFALKLNVSSCQEIKVSLSPQEVMIGDHLQLKLEAKNTKTIFPVIADSTIAGFRLIESYLPDTLYSGVNVLISRRFLITCFEDSIKEFPALAYSNPSNGIAFTKPINILVKSPELDSNSVMKPMKGIIQIPLSREEIYGYLIWSFIILFCMIISYFLFVKYVLNETIFDKGIREENLHVKALKGLKEIENLQLWQKGEIKEYYDKISDIVRFYLEKRFEVKALEKTTNEILIAIANIDMPDSIKANIEEILRLADLAKFAKASPDRSSNLAILKHAYDFVQNTQKSYDANKNANAMIIKKFYSQNKYKFRKQAVFHKIFKILLIGLSTTFLILALLIFASYIIPLNFMLGIIADSTWLFFLAILFAGIAVTAFFVLFIRSNMMNYFISFDYNSILVHFRNRHESILFSEMKSASIDSKGNIVITKVDKSKRTIPKNLEYEHEILERLHDVIVLNQKSDLN